MIPLDAIADFYPEAYSRSAIGKKHILKEYLQLMILDHLSVTPYIRKLTFIGGTCLRLVKGIDRFSEDLDFDCKGLTKEEFTEMTDGILRFLRLSGYTVEPRDRDNPRLKAYQRNIYFPELLFNLHLSGHREERFMIKVEAEDQGVAYTTVMANIKGCGFYFPMPVPPDSVLCAMKVSAMINRQKGRDIYDAMFLLSQTLPDFAFLKKKCGISSLAELKQKTAELFKHIDLRKKVKDFEHLLFHKKNSKRILYAPAFFNAL